MTRFKQDLAAGATLLGPAQTRFRLWAPAQRAVSVALVDGPTSPMQAGAEGWFEVELPCGVGSEYRYALADGMKVPDPVSRAQASGVHGPSVVVDPEEYAWRHPDWRGRPWEDAVLYELHPGLMGGYKGIAARLPALQELGVTAVELMPIGEFPGTRNWGYDGVLIYAPSAAYGTPTELKALIDRAHELGMIMFLDVVYNHFGPDGNYLGLYAPQMFRDDVKTPWGPAIDFRRPQVRRFFTENALYWLEEYRFDGLRLDAVHAINAPDWIDEMARQVRASVAPGRYVHIVLEHEGNVAQHLTVGADAQWNDDMHHALHVLLTGETEGYYADYAEEPAAKLARGLGEGFIYQGEASRHRGGKPRGTPSGHLPPTAFVDFLQNHDQIGNRAFGERMTVLADAAAVEAAIALLILSPHIPLLFMGEEDASRTPFFYFTDHHGELAAAVRKGRRAEFASFAAFADPKRRETIPDPNTEATYESSRPWPDPKLGPQRRALYRALLALRREAIVPRLRGARSLGARAIGGQAIIARWQMGDGAILTLASNLGTSVVAGLEAQGRCIFHTPNVTEMELRARRIAPSATAVFLQAEP